MTEKVLFVDDEVNILNALERLFWDSGIDVLKASDAAEALSLFQKQNIAVLVSDNRMPGMSGIELLSKVKQVSPDTVKILMTAYADLATAVEAINTGEVFRFIIKPWDDDILLHTVQDGVNRYRIMCSLRQADEATLLSLAQTIELKDRYTRGHCDRVARYALLIADILSLTEVQKKDIKYGSWLHDCGKIGVPEEILNHPGPLDEKSFALVKNHPFWGADVARQAKLSEGVVNIILYHHEKYGGEGYPSGIRETAIPLEARIVAVADTYDSITTDRPYRKGSSVEEAREILLSLRGNSLDPDIVDIFVASCLATSGEETIR